MKTIVRKIILFVNMFFYRADVTQKQNLNVTNDQLVNKINT